MEEHLDGRHVEFWLITFAEARRFILGWKFSAPVKGPAKMLTQYPIEVMRHNAL